jgi:hypothetical protein
LRKRIWVLSIAAYWWRLGSRQWLCADVRRRCGGGAQNIEPPIRILARAPDAGWLHCGPVGAGHFVKMIHNGIEYGMMQAFAEGIALLKGKAEPLAWTLPR